MKTTSPIRVKLRTILLIVNIMVFSLPLAGIMFFRVYENTLVQQTENELISQAAVISAIYKDHISKQLSVSATYGKPADLNSLSQADAYYTPISPQLDLSKTTILPTRGDGVEGQISAPFAMHVDEAISPMIIDAQKTTLSGIKLLDYNGVVIAGRQEIGIDFSDVSEVKRALSGYYTSVIRERISDSPPPALASISRGTGIRVFVAMPIVQDGYVWGVVYLSRTPQNILKHMYAEKGKVIFVIALLIMMAMLIGLLTSYMISRPIKRLIERTERMADGEFDAHTGYRTAVQEIELLSKSFTRMALSLNNRSEYIRDFAMHVSHEFKTPITAIQGSAELLLDHIDEMEESKKRQFLSNIIADSNRLKRLVSRLLDLARADNIVVSDEQCDVSDSLEKLRSRYSHDEGYDVVVHADHSVHVKISAQNLETIMINLCDNAHQNGASLMNIHLNVTDRDVSLRFRDNGRGISAANSSKIFTPFFTTRREQGGTGIGLGLVASLLSAHDGSIRLIDEEQRGDGGACFEITLKIVT